MMERAVILSTGDELITGRVDTNSSTIADKLCSLGLEVVAILEVGDTKERVLWALRRGVELGDLIIGTGGLGPTVDDLISEVVAEFPQGAAIIPNPVGTAPGFRIAVGQGKTLLWLSGVPKEMEAMLKESVLPWIEKERKAGGEISTCTFKIYGLTESRLDDILKPISVTEGVRLSFRAHYPDLSLRLTVRGGHEREKKFKELRAQIQNLIKPYIYGEGEETLEEIIGKLLLEKGWTLALAESCTGGYLSHRITRVAGSSTYFKSSAVTYSNESKIRFLGVKRATLEQYGAVSQETAVEMAAGIRRAAEADIGLSVTGIAGPSGGSPETPVGTVWVGLANNVQSDARLFRFQGDRERIILGASQAALNWLRTALL
ncbi:MAG: nicotinamide-nucleotide amidohydrolase family protein [Candidatus Binatia bacterium]